MVDSLLRCPIWLWTQASFFPSPSPPQRLQHQLDRCFLTFSHQSEWSSWFYFSHQRVLFFCFSFQINIYPEGVGLFSLLFLFYPESKSSMNPEIMEMAMQNKHKKESVPIMHSRDVQLFIVFPSSLPLFSLLCVIAYYFEHNVREVQNLKAAPSHFKWGTHCYTAPMPCTLSEGLKMYDPCALCKTMF